MEHPLRPQHFAGLIIWNRSRPALVFSADGKSFRSSLCRRSMSAMESARSVIDLPRHVQFTRRRLSRGVDSGPPGRFASFWRRRRSLCFQKRGPRTGPVSVEHNQLNLSDLNCSVSGMFYRCRFFIWSIWKALKSHTSNGRLSSATTGCRRERRQRRSFEVPSNRRPW